MSEPENPDPADAGAADEDEAAINAELAVLTSGVTLPDATEDEDGEVGEDIVGESDEDDDEGDDGLPDEDAADDLLAGLGLPRASEAPISMGDPEDAVAAPAAMTMMDFDFPADESDRIQRLESVTQALVSAATARDAGRVRRKVSASATGAAAAGVVPLILQLTGALNLSAEESATVTAAAAALASFITGYLTPERKPTLDSEVVHEALKVQ
jgi:hypothetical protein